MSTPKKKHDESKTLPTTSGEHTRFLRNQGFGRRKKHSSPREIQVPQPLYIRELTHPTFNDGNPYIHIMGI